MLRLGSRARRLIADVTAIAVTRDGTRLATGTTSVGDIIVVWDVATWDKLLEIHECAGSLDFSPDGSRLYVTYARATCHDTTTGDCLWSRRDVHHPAVLSPSGALFAAPMRDENALMVGPADTFHHDARRVAIKGEPLSLAFGPADDWLAVAIQGSPVQLLDLQTWLWRKLGQASEGHTCLAVSPVGDCIASVVNKGRVHLWSAAEPASPIVLGRPTAGWQIGTRLAFDPTGELLALTIEPFDLGVWRVSDRRHLWTKERRHGEGNVAFLRDGKTLVAGVGHAARRFGATDGQALDDEDGHLDEIRAVAACPAAGIVATASLDNSVGIWRLLPSSGPDETLCLPQRRFEAHNRYVLAVALSPDGAVVVSGGSDGDIAISDVATGRVVRRLAAAHDRKDVRALAFTRDGSLLASGGDDGTVKLWSTASWGERARFPLTEPDRPGTDGGIRAVAFAGDQLIAALGRDEARVVRLDGTPVLEVAGRWRDALATSPDGTRMALGTNDEVVVFEVPSGQRLRAISLEAKFPNALALSSANLLAIAAFRGPVRVLEHDTGLERFELPVSAGQASTLAFGGSTQLVVGMCEGTAVVVEIPAGDPAARARAWRGFPVPMQQRDVGELLAPLGAVATAGYRSAPIAADRDADGFGVRVRSNGNLVHVRIEPRADGIAVSVTAMPEQAELPVEAPPSYVRLAQWIRRRLPGPKRSEADDLQAWAEELLRTAPPGRVSASAAGPAVTVTFTLATLPAASWIEHVLREIERRLARPT